MSAVDAKEMGETIERTAHDLECIERMLRKGHMDPMQALVATQEMTHHLNTRLTQIVVRIHSQPIIPGMEKSPVDI